MSAIPTSNLVSNLSPPDITDSHSTTREPSNRTGGIMDNTAVMQASEALADLQTVFSPQTTTDVTDAASFVNQNKIDNEDEFSLSSSNHSRSDGKTKNNKRTRSDKEASKEDEKDGQKDEKQGKRRKKGKKPMDMPRRALSAYNIFFSEQRKLILDDIERKEQEQNRQQQEEGNADTSSQKPAKKENWARRPDVIPCVFKERRSVMTRTKRLHRKVHGKISLVVLAREVSRRWKELSAEDRKYYDDLAEEDKMRHKEAMNKYKQLKAAEHIFKRQQQEQQFNPLHSTMGLQSMDDRNLMMMMNNNQVYPSQQLQQMQLQQELQPLPFLDMMGKDSTSNAFQDAFIMEQQRKQFNRHSMFSNSIGAGDVEFGGHAFAPTAALPTPTLQAPQVSSTSAAHAHQGNVIPLTDLEHKMIMECRAAAAAASQKTMMQFYPTQGNQLEPINCYRSLNTAETSRTMCV